MNWFKRLVTRGDAPKPLRPSPNRSVAEGSQKPSQGDAPWDQVERIKWLKREGRFDEAEDILLGIVSKM
jgi:hypothetical protein